MLFDTGQDRASITDPIYFPTGIIGFVYRRLAQFQILEQQTLSRLLTGQGFDPLKVSHVVVSHLHQDHIGGIAEFPNAEILISKKEWDAHLRPGALLEGYMKKHINLPGLKWKFLEFEPTNDPLLSGFKNVVDIFNDGSLTILQTPGHTPGSISMLVRNTATSPVLLVGDLTYDAHNFNEHHIPGIGHPNTLKQTTHSVNALKQTIPGLVLCAAHDPNAASNFETAMLKKENM